MFVGLFVVLVFDVLVFFGLIIVLVFVLFVLVFLLLCCYRVIVLE